jgi:hypothetical protein
MDVSKQKLRINDHEVKIGLRPASESTKAKRGARRERSKPSPTDYDRGYKDGVESIQGCSFDSLNISDCATFAAWMTYAEAKAAFRAMASRLHPDHGGDGERMKTLNFLWERLEPYYLAKDTPPAPTQDLNISAEVTIQ